MFDENEEALRSLKEFIHRTGIKRDALSRRLDLPPEKLDSILAGPGISLYWLVDLCEKLGVSTAEL